MNKNSKIYVAGHTGLVGSAICCSLQKQGYTNIITKTHEELDLLNQQEVIDFFEKSKPEYVFLAAAKVGGIMANKEDSAGFMYENIMIEFNVIRYSYLCNVKKLMFLGSSCIYPKECPQPIKEQYLLTNSLEKTNEGYALAKIAGLKYIEYLNRQYKTKYISVMPTNLYGINDNYDEKNSHVIPAMIQKMHNAKINNESIVTLFGTGRTLREFMYSDDLADICITLMNKDSFAELINIGSGEEVTIKKLAYIIKDIIQYPGKIVFDSNYPDGTFRKRLDLSKIEKLNLKTKMNLREGLKIVYEDFLRRVPKCK